MENRIFQWQVPNKWAEVKIAVKAITYSKIIVSMYKPPLDKEPTPTVHKSTQMKKRKRKK